MRRLFFILSLFYSIYSNAQNNKIMEGEIIYNVIFGKNRENIEKEVLKENSRSSASEMKEALSLIFSSDKGVNHSIKFNKTSALSVPNISPEARTKKGFNTTQLILEEDGIFYTDLVNNVVYNDIMLDNKKIIVKHNIPELKWNISDETKEINGYKATKATAEYKAEKENGKQIYKTAIAWFSEDIPIKVAPQQFYGLPGLVVMLEAEGMTYVLESIQDKKVKVDYKINERRVISVDDYMDLINELD